MVNFHQRQLSLMDRVTPLKILPMYELWKTKNKWLLKVNWLNCIIIYVTLSLTGIFWYVRYSLNHNLLEFECCFYLF
ncbi:hypothetical protein GIB67_026518 [Kingdonia uniflora]|uniref:Uncharacterized protein n=1 Tax=Kingdonia uniflora TaxID=39325 RepID=A0A7J7PBL0_9MAGN|nr:hypothetical protein GIB67_026518 [Kingdonia uniflora]